MVEPIYQGQLLKLWDDTLGVCYFALRGALGTWDAAIQALCAAVGWEGYTRQEALKTGERLVNLQRLMALHLGYKREYDYDASPRMLGGLDAGPAKDKTIPAGPHLEQWFREYYECLDWDQDTGAPTPETLQRLDMAGLRVGRAGA